jgi:RNA polymerase sigma-70 factor (ECF subfamily)
MQADLTMGNYASTLAFQSEEAALIAELQAGSEEAFAWLIARYHQPIFHFWRAPCRIAPRPPT